MTLTREQIEALKAWPDPTPEMLQDPKFNAIWEVIKRWDINVPHAYPGYCGATGNHVRAILDALQAPQFQPAPKGNTMSIKTATNAIANAKVKLDELYARLIDDYDKLLAQDVMTHLKRADEALSDAEDAKTEAIQAWDKL